MRQTVKCDIATMYQLHTLWRLCVFNSSRHFIAPFIRDFGWFFEAVSALTLFIELTVAIKTSEVDINVLLGEF